MFYNLHYWHVLEKSTLLTFKGNLLEYYQKRCNVHLTSKTGKNRIVNADHIIMPTAVWDNVLETVLNLLMPKLKQQITEDMIKAGLRLDDRTAYYSLSQIRDYLHLIFGGDVAELLADVLRNTLEKTRQFEKYR